MVLDYWWRNMLKRRTSMSTTQNVDFKLFPWKRYSLSSSAPILFIVGTSMQKDLSLRWVQSSYMFQKLCAICCQCASRRSWESKLYCCRRNNQNACQQLLRLSIYESQSPHSHKIIERWKITRGYQHKIVQAFGSHQWSIVWSRIGEGRDWADRTNHCWVFHTPIR